MSTKKETVKILVANGVNLDLLGSRQPEIYGEAGLLEVENQLKALKPTLTSLFNLDFSLHFFQSNHEGLFLDELSKGWSGAIINPGAWTHTSLALADRLAGLSLAFIEVHISNIAGREEFRHHSFSAPHAEGVVFGFGLTSYQIALHGLIAKLAGNDSKP